MKKSYSTKATAVLLAIFLSAVFSIGGINSGEARDWSSIKSKISAGSSTIGNGPVVTSPPETVFKKSRPGIIRKPKVGKVSWIEGRYCKDKLDEDKARAYARCEPKIFSQGLASFKFCWNEELLLAQSAYHSCLKEAGKD